MDKVILQQCKDLIDQNQLEELKEVYESILHTEFDYRPSWEYIYQQTYIHACLRKRTEIVEWLQSIFPIFDDIAKIGIRQMFSYGNYLLRK